MRFAILVLAGLLLARQAVSQPDLRVGHAFHAFDHLGGYDHQAEAAAASGATIIYATGLGGDGYSGLPDPESFRKRRDAEAAYIRKAKTLGIKTVIGYLCATSIVRLDKFDANWTAEMRAEFGSSPRDWLQQDREGKPLSSWYGGEYNPACMSNPGWRAYERFMVRQQIETGHDGIFFDNPTVHPKGCYCRFCMEGFSALLHAEGIEVPSAKIEDLRTLAVQRPRDFLRFRATIARDFFADMRRHAKSLNPDALITANNSLNAPTVLYSQTQTHGFSLLEMSRAEDLIVVEDTATQPRTLPSGKFIEYGPTYKQLHSIIHGLPLVAVTIAEGDYHTPPNLTRLAMAEAAACGASYLSWPTWPEPQRERMSAALRSQTDWQRRNARYFNEAVLRRDAVLFLPFRRWTETKTCEVSKMASAMTAANLQYEVASEETFSAQALRSARALVAENRNVFNATERGVADEFERNGGKIVEPSTPDWVERLKESIGEPSIKLEASPAVRAYVADGPEFTAVHLLNLGIERVSSFEDKVTPAGPIKVRLNLPFPNIGSVVVTSADPTSISGPMKYSEEPAPAGRSCVLIEVPGLEVSAMVVVSQ